MQSPLSKDCRDSSGTVRGPAPVDACADGSDEGSTGPIAATLVVAFCETALGRAADAAGAAVTGTALVGLAATDGDLTRAGAATADALFDNATGLLDAGRGFVRLAGTERRATATGFAPDTLAAFPDDWTLFGAAGRDDCGRTADTAFLTLVCGAG